MAHLIGHGSRAWACGALAHALLAALLLFVPHAAGAVDSPPAEATAERRVKAAYLYRFAGYTEWPDSAFAKPESPLLIGVWGNDELAEDLSRLVATRTIDGRKLEVRRIREYDSLGGLHILFVARDRAPRLTEALGHPQLRAALVVTESAGALAQGSALNFVTIDGQIRFELSLEAAERRGLKLSSRLVAVSSNPQVRTR